MASEQPKVIVTVELEPQHAAALARLCDKFAHGDAAQYLYPHVPASVRDEQAYQMVHATALLFEALAQAGVRSWPWVEHGCAT